MRGTDARDKARADGFATRAWHEGNAADYRQGMALRWQVEDRARDRRARRVAALLALPWWVLLGLLVGALVVVGQALVWIDTHPVQAVLAAVLVGAALVLALRARQGAPVQDEAIAPHDIRRPLRLDPLTTPLPGEARAVLDSLDPGRGRHYLEALHRGMLPAPTRRRGEGYDVVEAPLPGGRVAPTDADLGRFAQTLGIDAARVRRGAPVPGVLTIDILDVAPADLGVGPWPSLGASTSWSSPMPLGVDEVGRPVALPIAGRRLLIVGQSGSGKSRLARTVALYAAADPAVTLHVADFKGSPALSVLKGRAAWLHQGPATDDVLAHLRGIVADMHRRYARMIDGEDVVARDGWVVLVMDEVQALWRQKGAADLVEEIARLGREAGVGLVLASQLPDKGSLPTAIAEQADVRVCLRVSAGWAAGLVVGDYGVDCQTLPPGHAWMNDGTAVRRIATHNVSDEEARGHLDGLPALPAAPALPVLTAGPAGDVEDDVQDDEVDDGRDEDRAVLSDLVLVLDGRPAASWSDLAAALDMPRPDLVAAARRAGVSSRSVRPAGAEKTARGCRLDEVQAALSAIDEEEVQ